MVITAVIPTSSGTARRSSAAIARMTEVTTIEKAKSVARLVLAAVVFLKNSVMVFMLCRLSGRRL